MRQNWRQQPPHAADLDVMVLSDLLDRSVATNRDLAQAYDRARIAGMACEDYCDSILP
ncbi:DUF2514 family protein [Pseudomonas plecoglossicida]|uniref:DUF2514 family protein n=1 Tax=Pseudomonas plecoglossicida TaxID=70775 RepID=UPI0009BBC5C5